MPHMKIKKEITPSHLRCVYGTCSGVFELDDGNLLIIGSKPLSSLHEQILKKIAPDELAIVINPAFFENLSKSS
jgi:hypothetical protein